MNKILIGVAVVAIVTAAILTYTSNLFFKQEQIPADKPANSSLYCGSGIANSNEYIKEYVIPTECSQPLGIIVDESGYVWFAESSARKIAKFDPVKESFEEFALPDATAKKDFATSGIWSMIFDANRDIWFSDVGSNAIWKFYRTTQTFEKYEVPTQKSFPLGLVMDENGKIWFTESFGKKFGYIDPVQKKIYELIPPVQSEIIGGITADKDNNIWFVTLNPSGGYVIKYEQVSSSYKTYPMPRGVTSPIGISIDNEDNVWVTDHGTNMFFKLNPKNNTTKTYVTSMPLEKTSLGTGGQPTSLPYWNIIDNAGRIWINEHQGNAIAVLDPKTSTLVEYFIPSQNPNWASCKGYTESCGISNPLQFTLAPDGKVWFVEWSESKIGVLDPTLSLPISINLNKDSIEVEKGKAAKISAKAETNGGSASDTKISLSGTFTPSGGLWRMNTLIDSTPTSDRSQDVTFTLNPSKYLAAGTYTLMISATYKDIVYSKALEVTVKEPDVTSSSFVKSNNFVGLNTGTGWVMVEREEYDIGDSVTISGGFLMEHDPTKPVSIKIYAPDDSEYNSKVVSIQPNGTFNANFQLLDIKLFGTYKILVGYANENTALSFNVKNPADKPDSFKFSFDRISYSPSFYCGKFGLTNYVESGETINGIANAGKIKIAVGSAQQMEAEEGKKVVKIPVGPIDVDSGSRIGVTHSIITVNKDGKTVWNSGLIHSHCGNTDIIIKSNNISIGDSLKVTSPFSMDLGVTSHFLQNVYAQTYNGSIFDESGEYTIEVKLAWIELRPIPEPAAGTFSFHATS